MKDSLGFNESTKKEIVDYIQVISREDEYEENKLKVSEHYKKLSIQPWDAMVSWMSSEQMTGFYIGNCIKYISRFNESKANEKGGIKDLIKAKTYLLKLISHIEQIR